MKQIFHLILFYNSIVFSQSAKDFLIDDNEKILKTSSSLVSILEESKNYGYNLERDEQNNYIFSDDISNFIVMSKKADDNNYEGFPNYSIGRIYKKYYFPKSKKISEAYPWKIETEIILLEYETVSNALIKKYFKKLLDDIQSDYLKKNYKEISTKNIINYKSMLGQYYDICYETNIEVPCKDSEKDFNNNCIIGNKFFHGESIENSLNNWYHLTYSFMDKSISNINDTYKTLDSNYNVAFENIRFNIGGQDMRKINTYDLEAMVKFFLEDCKKSNKTIYETTNLSATFEPLQGNLIALSYASGDDSSIIIKVDPEKWSKANIEKKWYVLYHELGHDVLNLEHGQGGKMMFNFADKEYSWDDFFLDKEYMFNFIKK